MIADDRSGPASGVSSSAAAARRGDAETQSASFEIGGLRLELTASPGAARLVVSADGARDTYVVEPLALSDWAGSTEKLLTLHAVPNPAARVEFRTPYLIDREGRQSIAFEGLVSELGVSYRLLVKGAKNKVAGLMIERDVVRGVVEAAGGAALLAQRAS